MTSGPAGPGQHGHITIRSALRLVDANGNRAAEGLRVLEDVARFLLDDPAAAAKAKDMRHGLRRLLPDVAVAARDTAGDIGTVLTATGEMERPRPVDLVRANAMRVCEALRSGEEACKLARLSEAAAGMEALRYGAYTLESALLSRLPAWLLHRVRLYALVDVALTADPVRVAAAVARGGAGAVQLRAKALPVRAYRELAARTQEAVRRAGSLFIVNDHVAVARALGADGVHIGQDDLILSDVRSVVGAGCAVGVSTHSAIQAAAALGDGADYLGLGPLYPTTTKPHEPCQGLGLLSAVRPLLQGSACRPSYGIGGLTLERVRQLEQDRLLPHGIAVAGALCRAEDPERAAAEFLSVLHPDEMP